MNETGIETEIEINTGIEINVSSACLSFLSESFDG